MYYLEIQGLFKAEPSRFAQLGLGSCQAMRGQLIDTGRTRLPNTHKRACFAGYFKDFVTIQGLFKALRKFKDFSILCKP